MKKRIFTIFTALMLIMLAGCGEYESTTWRVDEYRGYYAGLRVMDEDSDHPIIDVRFEFTNYSNEAISFDDALAPTIYQNGVELHRVDEDLAVDLPVAPGETHNINIRFYLENKTDLIEVEIKNPKTGHRYSIKSECR